MVCLPKSSIMRVVAFTKIDCRLFINIWQSQFFLKKRKPTRKPTKIDGSFRMLSRIARFIPYRVPRTSPNNLDGMQRLTSCFCRRAKNLIPITRDSKPRDPSITADDKRHEDKRDDVGNQPASALRTVLRPDNWKIRNTRQAPQFLTPDTPPTTKHPPYHEISYPTFPNESQKLAKRRTDS
jgi:hypothetical protein